MARNTSRVVGIDHISIRVSDYEKSKAFYAKLFAFLGFELSDDYGTTIGWTNGRTRYWIAPAEGRKSHRIGDVGFHHYAFELRRRKDVDALHAFLEKEKVRIVDPEGIIRFVSVNDLSVGRNPQEVLRVLDALQTDELCPCNWQKGDDVLKAA